MIIRGQSTPAGSTTGHRQHWLWLWLALPLLALVVGVALLLSDGSEDSQPPTAASTPAVDPEPSQPPGTQAPVDPTEGLRRLSEIASLVRPDLPGEWWCPEDRPVGYGSAFTCQLRPPPDHHTEQGNTLVVVLDDDGHYAVDPSNNCCGDPQLSDYPVGAFCRDLHRTPDARGPDADPGGGLSYVEAVYYWYLEGRPSRMDADGDGIPCETVYPAEEIAAAWGGHVPPEDPVFADVVQIGDVVPQLTAEVEASFELGSAPPVGELRWGPHIEGWDEIVLPRNAATPTATFHVVYRIAVYEPSYRYESADLVVTVHEDGGFDWVETTAQG